MRYFLHGTESHVQRRGRELHLTAFAGFICPKGDFAVDRRMELGINSKTTALDRFVFRKRVSQLSFLFCRTRHNFGRLQSAWKGSDALSKRNGLDFPIGNHHFQSRKAHSRPKQEAKDRSTTGNCALVVGALRELAMYLAEVLSKTWLHSNDCIEPTRGSCGHQ